LFSLFEWLERFSLAERGRGVSNGMKEARSWEAGGEEKAFFAERNGGEGSKEVGVGSWEAKEW
jgi:hypothetical protein